MPADLVGQGALSQGAWSHVVGLDLPPAPLLPPISLAWSSAAGNGPLGVGWRLTGAERIERRGAGGGQPAFDSLDTYWVDGQRLHWSTEPQQAGYRLEASDQRVFTLDQANGANHWVAQRDGWTWWYGERREGSDWTGLCGTEVEEDTWPCDDHEGSGVGGGLTTTAWHLTRIEDPHGNVVDFSYTGAAGFDGSEPGDWIAGARSARYLSSVRYAEGAYEVRFAWAPRDDVAAPFRGGTAWFEAARLAEIEVWAVQGGSLAPLETWDLAWLDEDAASGDACPGESLPDPDDVSLSYLHRIVRTAVDGTRQQVRCLEVDQTPTIYESEATALEDFSAEELDGSLRPQFTDFDGDGRTEVDAYWMDAGGTVSACEGEVLCGLPWEAFTWSTWSMGDLDGNGIAEVFSVTYDDDPSYDYRWTRRWIHDGVVQEESVGYAATDPALPIDPEEIPGTALVDLDGDGVAELVGGSGYHVNAGSAPFFRQDGWVGASGPGWWSDVLDAWLATLDLPEGAAGENDTLDVQFGRAEEDFDDNLLFTHRWTEVNGDGIADFLFALQVADLDGEDGVSFETTPAYGHVWLGDGTGGFVEAPWCVGNDACVPPLSDAAGYAELDEGGDLEPGEFHGESSWALGDPARTGALTLANTLEVTPTSGPDPAEMAELTAFGGLLTGWSGGRGAVGELPFAWLDDTPVCGEPDPSDHPEERVTTRLFHDVDGDGWADLYELSRHPIDGQGSMRWWRNLRTTPWGRLVRIHLPTGGVQELTYGTSRDGGLNPELPAVLDVVSAVRTENGWTHLTYRGGTWHDGRFRGYTDVLAEHENGASTYLKFAVSPGFAGREVWRTEHRADGTIAAYAYHHFLRPEAHRWFFDDEPPYFNPERRTCTFEVGPASCSGGACTQSVTVESLTRTCVESGIVTDYAGRSFALALGWDRWASESTPQQTLANRAWVPDGVDNADFPDFATGDPAEWSPQGVPTGTEAYAPDEHAPPPQVAVPAVPTTGNPTGGPSTETRLELTLYEYDDDERPLATAYKRDPLVLGDDRVRTMGYAAWDTGAVGKNVTSVEECDASGTCRETVFSSFSSFGRAQIVEETGTGPLGSVSRTTHYGYDRGLVATVLQPDGGTETYDRNACGAVTTGTDAEGRVATTEYDARCLETRRRWEGLLVETERDGLGRPTRRTTTPIEGGSSPSVVQEYLYDDEIADPDNRDDWDEPRVGVLRSGDPSTTADDRLSLRWLDPWGREALSVVCGNGGGDTSATRSSVLQAASCSASAPEVRVARTWATDGTPRSVSAGFGPDEEDVASSWTFADSTGRVTTSLEPAPEAAPGTWVEWGRGQTPGDVTVADPLGHACTTSWTTTGWSKACGGTARGSATVDAWGQTTAVRDGTGVGWNDTYDALGRRLSREASTSVETVLGMETPSWSWTWDAMHRLHTETDPQGGTTTWTRDHAGRPLTATFTAGILPGATSTTSWQWEDWSTGSPSSRRVGVADRNGQWTWTWLRGDGEAWQRLDPDGVVTGSAWDELGELSSWQDRDGVLDEVEHDAAGRRTAEVVSGTWRTEWDWTASGRVSTVVDPEGVETWYDHAWDGRIVEVTRPWSHGTSTGTWSLGSWTYLDDGRPWQEVLEGVSSEHAYDELGRRTETWRGGDSAVFVEHHAWTYDDADRVETATVDAEADGLDPATTTWGYNALGWRESELDAEGWLSTWAFDVAGRVRAHEDRDGFGAAWTYDAYGRVLTEELPGQGVRSFDYAFGTSLGERQTTVEPDGGEWTTWSDGLGRPWKHERPDGTGWERWWTGDRLEAVDHLDPGGAPVAFEAWSHDDRGRVLWAWGPAEGGWVSGSEPGPGDHAYRWTYDDGTAGDGAWEQWRLSPDDEETKWCWASGVVTCEEIHTPSASPRLAGAYVWDPSVPRVIASGLGDGIHTIRSKTWEYDDLGRAVEVTSAVGTDTVTSVLDGFDPYGTPTTAERWSNGALESRHDVELDLVGRVLQVDVDHVSWSETGLWSWTHEGRPASAQTSLGDGFLYTWDASTESLTEVRSTSGALWAEIASRDALGRATRIETGAAGTIEQQFDLNGRVESWSATDGTDTETRAWSYDDRGRPWLVEHGGTGGAWQESRTWQEPGWLVSESRSNGIDPPHDERSYGYDAAGNRLTTTKGGVTTTQTYDGSFLATVDGVAVSWDKDAISADAKGNAFAYAADGLEAGVSIASGPTYAFGRDPFGRPAWTSDGTATRRTIWGNPGGAWPLAVQDEGGDPKLRVAVEGVLVGEATAGLYQPGATDPAGNLVFLGSDWVGVPDAFGESAELPATSSFRHVYGALESLPDGGGLQLAQQRLYDAGTGRFTRADPLGLGGGDHRFTYAENDPTTLWDPAGLYATPCGVQGMGGNLETGWALEDKAPAEVAPHSPPSLALQGPYQLDVARVLGFGTDPGLTSVRSANGTLAQGGLGGPAHAVLGGPVLDTEDALRRLPSGGSAGFGARVAGLDLLDGDDPDGEHWGKARRPQWPRGPIVWSADEDPDGPENDCSDCEFINPVVVRGFWHRVGDWVSSLFAPDPERANSSRSGPAGDWMGSTRDQVGPARSAGDAWLPPPHVLEYSAGWLAQFSASYLPPHTAWFADLGLDQRPSLDFQVGRDDGQGAAMFVDAAVMTAGAITFAAGAAEEGGGIAGGGALGAPGGPVAAGGGAVAGGVAVAPAAVTTMTVGAVVTVIGAGHFTVLHAQGTPSDGAAAPASEGAGKFPGMDPAKAPEGYEWRGRPGSDPGSKSGNYHNPETGESLRPDLDHPDPVGPHWDYRAPDGTWYRIKPDGTMEPK